MELTLIVLFAVSALLLLFSIAKNFHESKVNHREVDLVHVSMMKEINTLQESIRDLELDIEVVTNEAGIQLPSEKRLFLREVIDLYKRNYSIESIAKKKEVAESEIEQMLAPFLQVKDEGSKVVNEN